MSNIIISWSYTKYSYVSIFNYGTIYRCLILAIFLKQQLLLDFIFVINHGAGFATLHLRIKIEPATAAADETIYVPDVPILL